MGWRRVRSRAGPGLPRYLPEGSQKLGAIPAGPSPLPPIADGDAVEVERTVNRAGHVSLGQHTVLAAELLAGRRVGIRIEPAP